MCNEITTAVDRLQYSDLYMPTYLDTLIYIYMYWFNISNALHNIQCTLYSTTDHNVHCIIFAQRFKLYCLHVSTIYLNLIISNNSLHSYSRNP